MDQPSSRSDLPKSLICMNEEQVSEGWSCASQGFSLETASVAGWVWPDTPKYFTQKYIAHYPSILICFSTFSYHFTPQGSADLQTCSIISK